MKPTIVKYPLGDDPPEARLYYGVNVLEGLRQLPDASVHMVATSPPYWGLRDYGVEGEVWGGNPRCSHEWGADLPHGRRGNRGVSGTGGRYHPTLDHSGQGGGAGGGGNFCIHCDAWKGALGLEPNPQLFTAHLVEIFQEVSRVLRSDGTLWLNLGDSYAHDSKWGGSTSGKHCKAIHGDPISRLKTTTGLKSKDLVGLPWRVAFALQDAGWYLRSDIIWSKPNPMPESVQDRFTKSHEYIFLFAHPDSRGRYFFDQDSVREPNAHRDSSGGVGYNPKGRNKRTVWDVNTKPYPGAHFSVWPAELVKPMVQAGTSSAGVCGHCGAPWGQCECPDRTKARAVVLDPFSGSATTGQVAMQLDRDFIGIDLQADYLDMARARLQNIPSTKPTASDLDLDESQPDIVALLGV